MTLTGGPPPSEHSGKRVADGLSRTGSAGERAARIFAEAQYRAARAELDAVKASTAWRLIQRLYPLRFRFLPRGSRREAVLQWLARGLLRSTAQRDSSLVPTPTSHISSDDGSWPKVSIVIVTYNNVDLTELCLHTVLTDTNYPDYEVIVVDNGSADGTPEMLARLEPSDPRVRVILQAANTGFAAASNVGASEASGEVLCFLNNDTVVYGDWLRSLVSHLERNPRLGLVGPTTNAIANEARVDVDYADLAAMRAWADAYCAAHRGVLVPIPMLAFFCVVMPRTVWERVGLLDTRFVRGMFEDDDYCRRVREAGWDVKCARDSFVHHWQSASFRLLPNDEYLRLHDENQARFKAKWDSR